ncbi:biliverdin-producing heme oxygenase [Geodermatophilus sp. YIM 151500]|uniref:biliverdin-producing heme oxygenase n=1 Tax=Geodermatophilus sp. YIM 151500 TaxID=2984531 RepID=UPI0021E46801|nr:biliverdin-producing heme oxygenase [Geodermatophilus sp. YIM 151500]MCV2491527.1 biliverdin-producing heme oxygenase [Geodermatophilus sp. YIM 151500]
MTAERTAAPADRGARDVLRRLRVATAADHGRVERHLDLMAPGLDRDRLASALALLHGFWRAAEAGLDAWAVREPAAAAALAWPHRRRAALFAADLAALGARPADAGPLLPTVAGTDAALGRMYVLEGATLGGVVIDRHLAGLPALAGVRLRAFSPYGSRTGAMWAAYRRAVRAHVAAGGDADAVVTSARGTFAALARWCGADEPVRA